MSTESTVTQALEPCPFCGGGALYQAHRIAEDAMVAFVNCQRCGVQTEHFEDAYAPRVQAIAAWNTRTAAQPEREAVLEVRREDMLLRAEIWNTLGHDQRLGKALTRYGMVRFSATLDEIIARHRLASQSEREAVLEVPKEGSEAIFQAIRKARDSGCSIRNLWDDIVHAALATPAPTSEREAVLEEAALALHPAWFPSDYNWREAQTAIRALALKTTPAPAEGGKLGWDADGMCDDHGRFACKTCALTTPAPVSRDEIVAVLGTAKDYFSDAARGALTYEGSGDDFKVMAKEDLERLTAILSRILGEGA